MKLGLIVTAGGSGKRLGGVIPKQFHTIKNQPIIVLSLENLLNSLKFDVVVVTYPIDYYKLTCELLHEKFPSVEIELVPGGNERFDSVRNALQNQRIQGTDYVFIHDAVRPFVSKELIIRLYENVLKYNAVAPAIKIKDTLKEVDDEGFILKTIDRKQVYAIQTPQAFRTELIISAYEKAISEEQSFTDEAGVVENFGQKVKIIEGDEKNIKITTPDDLLLAMFIFEKY
ncbi:MAG: 2-C-methyl-D-erythritol 4-phosphate cytidylyltransferase [Ignavibacteria bacterium]|nr:2-C-methyl-D-erythritol 4-phosphate cytidylyltransferase [Ignavibacteria bacterium]